MTTKRFARWAVPGLMLASSLSLPACHVVAAAGLGFALSQEFADNAHSLRLQGDLGQVWAATQRTLDSMSLDPVEIDAENHILQAVVRGAQVTAKVRAHDNQETVLSVTAKSYGRFQNDLAQEILFRVKDRMQP